MTGSSQQENKKPRSSKKKEDAAPAPRVLLPAKSPRPHRIKKFIEKYIPVPEGMLVGKPTILLPEQEDFLERVYGNVDHTGRLITRRGILSTARKNGKTGFIAPILGAHLIGPETKVNSQVYSAARSRDQASVVFRYLSTSLRMNSKLDGLVQITDSTKRIHGLAKNAEYKALSADAATKHGLSPALVIHDELGQVIGPNDALYDALETAGGAQEEPLSLIISTQAASDADLLSQLIDDALRNPTPEIVACLYSVAPNLDVFDEKNWRDANFALGVFRSLKDLREYAAQAKRMPSFEAAFRNLYMNQRISLLALLVAPTTWKENNVRPDDSIFYSGLPVHFGLDLSSSRDLTAAVASVQDPDTGVVHAKPWVYTPLETLEQRAIQDRAPYPQWVREGKLIALPGKSLSYDMICAHLASETERMNIAGIHFDRWRIDIFKKAALESGFAVDPQTVWKPVGQGFRDMSPRIEKFEEVLFECLLAHGSHALLNMAAANSVVVFDPAKNRKIDKAKSSARIDPMVALVMSVAAHFMPDEEEETKKKPTVTDSSFFFM